MSDLDDMLARLARRAPPEAIAGLGDAVLRGAALRRAAFERRRSMALASGIALMLGLSSAAMPYRAAADPAIVVLPALAPSELLLSGR